MSVKDTMDKPDTSKVVKKPDLTKDKTRSTASIEKPEPIQLPSFPFAKVRCDTKNIWELNVFCPTVECPLVHSKFLCQSYTLGTR